MSGQIVGLDGNSVDVIGSADIKPQCVDRVASLPCMDVCAYIVGSLKVVDTNIFLSNDIVTGSSGVCLEYSIEGNLIRVLFGSHGDDASAIFLVHVSIATGNNSIADALYNCKNGVWRPDDGEAGN